jgi:hypothetical protein
MANRRAQSLEIHLPSCFDAEAERAGVRYNFASVQATLWSDIPEPQRRYGRRRR